MNIIITSKDLSSTLCDDFDILENILKDKHICSWARLKDIDNKDNKIDAVIYLDDISSGGLEQYKKILITDCEIKHPSRYDYILCKTKSSYNNNKSIGNILYSGFTSYPLHSRASKSSSIISHYISSSSDDIIKLWIKNNGFLDVDKDCKLILISLSSPSSNNYWKSLDTKKVSTVCNKKINASKFMNMYMLDNVSKKELSYFQEKCGCNIIADNNYHSINIGRCVGNLVITTSNNNMSELISDKKCLIKVVKNKIDEKSFTSVLSRSLKLSTKEWNKISRNNITNYKKDTKYFKDVLLSLFNNHRGGYDKYDIELEYSRYILTTNITKNMLRGYNNREKYEMKNIIERLLLTMVNDNIGDRKNDIKNIFCKITNTPAYVTKAVEEIMDKKLIISRRDAESFINSLFVNKINNFITNKNKNKSYKHGNIVIKNNELKYKSFSFTLPRDRMTLLLKYGDSHLVRCSLRYAAMQMGGQQWSIPKKQYDHLINKYKVNREGFASPFNSQIIGRGKFCSMFKDTDEIYGSIGSFFTAEISGYNWVINPPFTATMLIDSADRSIKAMGSDKKTFIFYIMPYWNDITSYDMLLKSKYTKYTEILNKNSYFYEKNNKKFTAKFKSVVFILTNYDCSIPSNICKNMKH